jgi:cytochrome P450
MATLTTAPTLADIDLTDLDRWVQGVPYDWFELLRREAPAFWQEERSGGRGFWSITRYEDVVAMSKDWETFSNARGGTSLMDLTPEQIKSRMSMLDADPPYHTRLRSIVNKAFTPRAILSYEDRIRALIREILTRTFEEDEFDYVARVSMETPMWVLCEIMGTAPEDRQYLIQLGDAMLGNTDPDTAGEYVLGETDLSEYAHLPFSSPAALEMFDYGHALAAERRTRPRNDITTRLIEADVDGDRLSEHEFDLFFLLLVTAGNETTRHAISHGTHALLSNRDQIDRLVADPSLVPTAVEEVLRWATSVLHFRRTATRDVELHGEVVRKDDKVVMWFISGNRDENQFPDPLRFDVGRTPNRHVAFGLGGPHFCLGAHLARLELRIFLEEMLPYLPHLELAGPPERLRSNFFHGIKRMPVAYTRP